MDDTGGSEASKAISEMRRKPKFAEPSKVLCGICHETRDRVEIFRNTSCYHLYCFKCLSAYVVHKKIYGATSNTAIICPASVCKAVLDLGPGLTPRSEPSSKHQVWKDLLGGPGETSRKRVGEPSQKKFSSLQICEICCESKEPGGMFRNELGCLRHRVCTECISKYVKVKLESDVSGRIPCPGLDCKVVLSPEHCKGILPSRVVKKWEKKIIQALIPDAEKFYCPFKDCSAMLLNDNADGEMMMMRESECPHCRRLFCVRCRVPWHSGKACSEYQAMNDNEKQRDDEMLKKLAHENRWQRCPKCKFYVEKVDGCMHMTCRSAMVYSFAIFLASNSQFFV